MLSSWRTTLLGIFGGVALGAQQVVNLLDTDPETVFVWQEFLAALSMLGLGWLARDNNVSSETAKAK